MLNLQLSNSGSSNSLSSWSLLLFGLIFSAIGMGVAIWSGNTLLTWHSVQSWEEVPAQILRAELEVHHNHRDSRDWNPVTKTYENHSRDSITYNVAAEYDYEYGGQKHTSHDVGLFSGGDNIGSFQQDTYRELSQYQKTGQPFHCYVNPARPEQALLYRDLRWAILGCQMLFMLAFGGVGIGMLIAAAVYARKKRSFDVLATAYPEMPWMWKPDWAAGQIVSSSKTEMVAAVVVATIWNLISGLVWLIFVGVRLPESASLSIWFLRLLFPAVGLGLLGWAIVAVLRWRKFGQSVFRMASVPGVIGGQLAGVIQTSSKIRPTTPADGFHLTLTCVRRIMISRDNGKSTTTQEDKLWEKTQIVAHELLDNTSEISAIPIEFQIPAVCLPTDETTYNNSILWRLKVTAREPGIGYSATFEVPVFNLPSCDASKNAPPFANIATAADVVTADPMFAECPANS